MTTQDPRDIEAELAAMRETVAQLQRALDTRIVLEQAKGILSERHQVTLDEAFELMRSYSRARGIKVHDVARAVIDGRLSPDRTAHG